MITDVEKTIREYLPNVIHMSLATSRDNTPWMCEVHFVFDENLNLYFRSRASTRHCEEIKDNEKVAGNIVKQHAKTDKPRGVYFEGKGEVLAAVDENSPAYLLYNERFGTNSSILEEAKTEHGHKFYKITVSKFYLYDLT